MIRSQEGGGFQGKKSKGARGSFSVFLELCLEKKIVGDFHEHNWVLSQGSKKKIRKNVGGELKP